MDESGPDPARSACLRLSLRARNAASVPEHDVEDGKKRPLIAAPRTAEEELKEGQRGRERQARPRPGG